MQRNAREAHRCCDELSFSFERISKANVSSLDSVNNLEVRRGWEDSLSQAKNNNSEQYVAKVNGSSKL